MKIIFTNTPIMSYAVKYCIIISMDHFVMLSDSAPSFGDRKSYQMDYQVIAREAIKEAITFRHE